MIRGAIVNQPNWPKAKSRYVAFAVLERPTSPSVFLYSCVAPSPRFPGWEEEELADLGEGTWLRVVQRLLPESVIPLSWKGWMTAECFQSGWESATSPPSP